MRSEQDPAVVAERRLREQFDKSFIQLSDAIKQMHLSPQYGRQLILDSGVPEQDYFMIASRYFVSTDFIARLKGIRKEQHT